MDSRPSYEVIPVPGDCPDRTLLYEQCIQLRIEVFVHEQKFALEDEEDEVDPLAIHFLLRLVSTKTPIGTLRVYQPTGANCYKLGRLVVLKQYRQLGLGAALMKAAHEYLRKNHKESTTPTEIVLHSQLHAKGFYTKFGYLQEGEEFDEDGAPHQKMRIRLSHPD